MFRKLRRNRHRIVVAFLAVSIASGAVGAGLWTFAPRATLNSVSMIARTLNFDSAPTQETSVPSTVGPTGSQRRGTLTSPLTDAGRRIFSQATGTKTGTNKGSPGGTGDKNGVYSRLITNHSSGAGKSPSIKAGEGMDAPGGANSQSGGAAAGGGTLDLRADRTASSGPPAIGSGSTSGDRTGHNHIEPQQHLAPLTDISWTGLTSTSWNLATNWSSLTVPGASDNAVFNSTFILGRQPQVTAITTVGGLWMTTGVGQNVTISSSMANVLTLNGNTINGIPNLGILVDNSSAFTLTISARLALGNSQTWINNSANLLSIIPGGATLVTNGHALTIGGSGNTSISKVISGTGSLTKDGGGTLTLAGANTYSGTTTVNAGTLLVNGSTSSSSTVTVNNSGTTLGGIGTSGGTVTVNALANIAPGDGGNTTAILSTGALTLAPTSNFLVDINGTTAGSDYDRLNVTTGGVTIGGSNLIVTVGTTLTIGQTFLVVEKVSAGAVSGTFAQGSTVTSGPYAFSIDYTGSDGNDIVLTVTAVPEPSTWIGGALALAALGYTQRRRFLGGRDRL
jgi:fibronectin-binding autotransporter adhesin